LDEADEEDAGGGEEEEGGVLAEEERGRVETASAAPAADTTIALALTLKSSAL
jgi:hypothetical protein